MLRFSFLKAFLLDRDMASITISPYFEELLGLQCYIQTLKFDFFRHQHLELAPAQLRLSEDKTKEQYVELPLCVIRQKYQGVPGGDKFVEDLLKSCLS